MFQQNERDMTTVNRIQSKGYKFSTVANKVKGQENYCLAEKNGRKIFGKSATDLLSKI